MAMVTSPSGRQAIGLREGIRLQCYLDTKGIPTIGVGHTSAAGPPLVREGLTITMAECDRILAADLGQVEHAVSSSIKVAIGQNAFDACVSLAFNIGAPGFMGSTVVHQINAGNMAAAADAFLMWNKPPELLGRRQGERAQFLRPDVVGSADAALTGPESPVGSISWAQTRLNEFGADPKLEVDGDLGPATLAAVTAFQAAHGLLVDGLIGPHTMAALSRSS